MLSQLWWEVTLQNFKPKRGGGIARKMLKTAKNGQKFAFLGPKDLQKKPNRLETVRTDPKHQASM